MKPLESLAPSEEGAILEPEGTASLVTRALAGDAEAFRCLVEAHERAVFGLCRRLLYGNRTEAEDLTQETFLRAYEHMEKLEDKSRFASWLYQIARSLCRDRRRRQEIECRALRDRSETLRRELLQRRGGDGDGGDELVPSALDDLPPEEREALRLRYFSGLTFDEIGERLSLSFSKVDHLIRKARARLSRRYFVRQRFEK